MNMCSRRGPVLFVKKITFKKGVDMEVKMSIIILDKERRKIK
jgi:hypothetical protein